MPDYTSSIPVPIFGPNGFLAPTEPSILTGSQADINNAFGGGLNNALETPQGQLASSWTATLGSTFDILCSIFNGVDPAYATGRMQDAIGRIYFIQRFGAQSTVVQALCTGAVGTKIPAGSIAKAEDGNLYTSTQDGKITASGNVTIPFACNTPGPIPCPEGALDSIYRQIPDWDTITNPTEGVIGRSTETRRQFEERRSQSVAINANGYTGAIYGAVLAVNGVLDAYVLDNPNNTPLTVGDYTIPANALYVAAVGGTDANVAQAIWTKKAPGCSYNGNTNVNVKDRSYPDPPYPTYTVKFQRPASLPILFSVNLQNSPDVPSDADVQIQNAIINAFAGEDGGPRARIGGVVYASRYNAPIAALGSWAQIIEILVGSSNTDIVDFTGSITGTVLNASIVASGMFAIGQTIVAPGVADGTKILSFGSGTGGTGTYNLSGGAQTVGTKEMFAVLPDQNFVDVEIDQSPTISAANIDVILTS